jgi:class 3 adenylate cyclase
VQVAYQIVGDGSVDVLMLPGWTSHLTLEWEEPTFVRFMERLMSFARVVRFDKRGTGLSDRPPGIPTLEERMEDAHAVMDAAGLRRAALLGWSEGGPMAVLFAATYPARVTALILYGTQARFVKSPDYPWGSDPQGIEAQLAHLEAKWGRTVMAWLAPSGDTRYQACLLRYQQAAASPAAAVALQRANKDIDVRDVLPAVRVPTLVVSRRGDPVTSAAASRYLAERIPDARFVELDGADHTMWLGDVESLVGEIEEFLTGERRTTEPDRVLATLLFTDIVGSTRRAAELGDRRWRDLVETHDALLRKEIERFRGRAIETHGDGFLATFDGPARAIRCARAITDAVRPLGIEIRTGLHTGECELMGDRVGGLAVHVSARVAAESRAGEVLVSSTVRDLVAGSGLEFDDRGVHALKGVPGEWRLFAVRGPHGNMK